MDNALRMHHHVNAIIRQIEEKVRLDYFERLVGERRAVDGDLATHLPRWMSQRVFDGGLCELLFAPATERPTRRSQHNSSHLRCGVTCDALQNRAVLAIYRNDLAASGCARLLNYIAGNDQCFLVGESDAFSFF